MSLTNFNGSMYDPVLLGADPMAGFAPLHVPFQAQAKVPETIQQVLYDYNGDDLSDLIYEQIDAEELSVAS